MDKLEFQKKRTEIISEMLDNPDKTGIYPTGKCFDKLDQLFDKINAEHQPNQQSGEIIIAKDSVEEVAENIEKDDSYNYCPNCSGKIALVSGSAYMSADEEPYKADECIEIELEIEPSVWGHYCENCCELVNIGSDQAIEDRIFQNQIARIESELKVTDQLLDARNEVLSLIPECPTHGFCLPHFKDWIESAKRIESEKMELVDYLKLIVLNAETYGLFNHAQAKQVIQKHTKK